MMDIGCLKEIKQGEHRVGMTPSGVHALTANGHRVFVERGAGESSGFPDKTYQEAGAEILAAPRDVAEKAELIVKVKEPVREEWPVFREGQVLFTYLHLAASREVTHFLLERTIAGIAYETVEDSGLPLLTPMSEVAGRMAVQVGAHYLERTHGGSGRLLGGVPGVLPGRIVIVGTGIVGCNACQVAVGLGAEVTMIGRNLQTLRKIDALYRGRVKTLFSTHMNIAGAVKEADLLVGAVYVTGARAPTLVTREMVRSMADGSVIVDVAVDQGGIVETIRPTSHQQPTYVEEGVIHYGVTNMPGAVPHTSTIALTNATLPYLLEIAEAGIPQVFRKSEPLRKGLNTWKGKIARREVALSLGMEWEEPRF